VPENCPVHWPSVKSVCDLDSSHRPATKEFGVSKKALILDPSEYDVNHVIADIDEIRRYNRQRYEMEQLTAICYEDPVRHICAGYKDLGPDEFWVRGHMPGMPIMPGVVMCEAAAQMASYYTQKRKLMDTPMVGFGGLKDVRFRGVVRPGERFVIVAQLLRVRSTMLTCQFQCFVRENMVCDGILKGIPLPEDLIKEAE
jgi:3-hydroxyacyl-[acyl-carrier-protein] dehydratase